MYYFCDKYCKRTTVQYYIANCVSWVLKLFLLDLGTCSQSGTCLHVGPLLYSLLSPLSFSPKMLHSNAIHHKECVIMSLKARVFGEPQYLEKKCARKCVSWHAAYNLMGVLIQVWLPPHGLQPASLLCLRDSPGKNTGVGCHFLHRDFLLTTKGKWDPGSTFNRIREHNCQVWRLILYHHRKSKRRKIMYRVKELCVRLYAVNNTWWKHQ